MKKEELSAFLLISSLVSIGGLFGVTAVGAEVGVVDDHDQCPPNMDVIGTACHIVSEKYFTKQSEAKAFCQNQTWEQKKGRLFTPTTVEHGKAAMAFVKKQRAHKGGEIEYVWTDWIKDRVTHQIISPSNPHFQWPTELLLWNDVSRRQDPDHLVKRVVINVGIKKRSVCIVMGEEGAAYVGCERWRQTHVYALCEFD